MFPHVQPVLRGNTVQIVNMTVSVSTTGPVIASLAPVAVALDSMATPVNTVCKKISHNSTEKLVTTM